MKLLVATVLAGTTALVAPVWAAQPARATSCVGWPDDIARQAVAGRLPAAGMPEEYTRTFTDSYDYALIGTVRSVDEHGLLRSHAEVDVEVEAAFYRATVPATVTLSMSDGGGMNGYPFEPGRSYFIPVKNFGGAFGQKGRGPLPDYVMVCDPVQQLAAGEGASLVGVAERAGVTVSRPGSADHGGTGTDPARSAAAGSARDRGPWSAIGAWTVILAGVAGAVAVAVARSRGSRSGWRRSA